VTPFAQKKRAEIEKNVAAARARFQMQAVEREAAQLVRQFHAAPFRQQAHVDKTLVEFCCRQPHGREWQDAGGRAGVVVALVQVLKMGDTSHHWNVLFELWQLMESHHHNQSAAAAAGAIPHLMQLTKSSNTALRQQAVIALKEVVRNHHDNQSAAAAAGAISQLLQLTKCTHFSTIGSALDALGRLVADHTDNQYAAGTAGAVECMCNLMKNYLMSFEYFPIALEAAFALNDLASLAENARRAVSMGAVPLLLQLNALSGGEQLIDQVLAKLGPPPMPSSEPSFAAAVSAAPAPVPAPARRLAPGSRVRIEGLQGRPEMNGRTGVICGALQQASMLCSC